MLRDLTEYLTREGHASVLEAFFADRVERQRQTARRRLEGVTGRERLHEVAAILTEEGFVAEVVDPEGGDPALRLCHCPLKEMVAVSKLPCRAEIGWIQELLGTELTRLTWMPEGDRTCTYRVEDRSAGSTSALQT